MKQEQAKNEINFNVYLTLDGKSDSVVRLFSAGLEFLEKLASGKAPEARTISQNEPASIKSAEKEDRESMIKRGLELFLHSEMQDFFSPNEIATLSEMLTDLRYRKSNAGIPSNLCRVVTRRSQIVSYTQPSNEFRKDEIAILINNVMPYAHLSRKEASIMIKRSFPGLFGNTMPDTINATLTKFKNVRTGHNRRTLNVTVLSLESAKELETYLYNLAKEE